MADPPDPPSVPAEPDRDRRRAEVDRRRAEVAPLRLVVPLAAAVGVAFGAVLYGFSVLLTAGAAGGAFSTSVLSSAFGGSVLISGVAAIPVGRWVDRRGVRPVLRTGGALIGVGFVGFAVAVEPWQVLAVWWLLIGPGCAMALFDPAFVALQRWFGPMARNRAAGTLTLGTGLAGPIFVPATTAAVGLAGWRATAAGLGLLVALVSSIAVVRLRDAPPSDAGAIALAASAAVQVTAAGPSDPPTVPASSGSQHRATSVAFVLVSVSVALLFGVLEAVQVHRIARFEAAGFSASILATWAAVSSLSSLPGRYLVPRLADRADPARVVGWSILALVPAVALAIRGTSHLEMVGHFLLFGLLFGATIPMRAVLMGDRFAGPSFGVLMGIQAAAIAFGRAIGPAAVGWSVDATSAYGPAIVGLVVALGVSYLLLATGIRPRVVRVGDLADGA